MYVCGKRTEVNQVTDQLLKEKLDYVMRCAFDSLSGAKIIVDEKVLFFMRVNFIINIWESTMKMD